MAYSIPTLARIAFGLPPELTCDGRIWREGMRQLRVRAGGRRESGAFLLGPTDGARRIEEFVYYDDIDPGALRTGIVLIDGRNLGALWDHCRETRRRVVADVHVHPGGFRQSQSDRANPIIAEVGHMALIVPDFAIGTPAPGRIGIYEYLGNREWHDRSAQRPAALRIGGWPRWR